MTKILILVKNIDGGTGTFVFNLMKLKKIMNIDINLALIEYPSFRKIEKNTIDYFFSNKKYREKYEISLDLLRDLIRQIFWFKKILDRSNPDLIITVDLHCLFISQMVNFLFKKKIRVISTIHNNIKAVIKYKIPKILILPTKFIIGFFLKKTNKLVAISQDLSDEIKNLFNLKSYPEIIYYGINKSIKGDILINKKIYRKNIKKIITIARLTPQKDLITLIKAFKILNDKLSFLKLKLLILGDGVLKKKMKIFTEKIKLREVKFLGWINNPLNFIKKADIFVLSSNWEGFSYTLIEAMAYGLPIISTNTPFGPREILDNGKYGILVPMKDPKAMADAMYELLTNKRKYQYYSKKSLERVKYFSLDKMLRNYKKLILDLLKE